MSRDGQSSYYDAGGIETLDIIRAKLTEEQYRGYLLGNVLKYTSRANFKGNRDRDIEKAANYLVWLHDDLQEAMEKTGGADVTPPKGPQTGAVNIFTR